MNYSIVFIALILCAGTIIGKKKEPNGTAAREMKILQEDVTKRQKALKEVVQITDAIPALVKKIVEIENEFQDPKYRMNTCALEEAEDLRENNLKFRLDIDSKMEKIQGLISGIKTNANDGSDNGRNQTSLQQKLHHQNRVIDRLLQWVSGVNEESATLKRLDKIETETETMEHIREEIKQFLNS